MSSRPHEPLAVLGRGHCGGTRLLQRLFSAPFSRRVGGSPPDLGADPCHPPSRPQEEPTTWTGYFGKVLMASTSYLPSQVTEMFNQGRAFATVRLPFCGHKNICALAT